jgi:outer membrane beta-barrel protein
MRANFGRRILIQICIGLICLSGSTSFGGEVIEFSENELATESVLPVFNPTFAVKNRTVETANRIELGLLGAHSLTEAFYNSMAFGGTATYHIDEEHGLNLLALVFASGLSNYGSQLNPVPGTSTNLNLQLAPSPQSLFLGSWQYSAFYGKLSVAKDFIMNLSLYGLLGAGTLGVGEVNLPALSAGLGQKFHFGPRFAVRFDLRFLMYQGPDVLSSRLDNKSSAQPASYFSEKLQFLSLLSLGAVYLLPEM